MVNHNAGQAKQITKDIVWKSVHHLAYLLFKCSDKDLAVYLRDHGAELSRAEIALLNASKDPRVIWAFIERIIGKAEQHVDVTCENITHEDILRRLEESQRESTRRLLEKQTLENGKFISDNRQGRE